MAFPLATGGGAAIYPAGSAQPNPAYSGNFIPEIWSGKMIEKFYSATVLAAISNTDYEGEIKNMGDKVKIRTTPTITIRDYVSGQPLVMERPSSAPVELNIDKGKYFACILDDVMEIQSDTNLMAKWSDGAGEQMKITVDTDVLMGIRGLAASTNRGATAGAKSANINLGVTTAPVALVDRNPSGGQVAVVDYIVRLGQVLDEANIPENGRWIVVPTWVGSKIKTSELRDASLSGDGTSILRNGRLGQIDRFTIYTSNLSPSGVAGGLAAGEWFIYAGHSHALTFASQMNNVETIRSESAFGTILRGLQVFGYGVLDGTALVQGVVA